RGTGNGVFTPIVAAFPVLLPAAASACATDLDGDGDLDVVVGHESSATGHRATVLENDGNGQFLAVASLVPPPHDAPTRAVLAADLDGDGDQDLIVQPSIYGQVRTRVLRNDGAFAFVDVSDDHIQGAGELWRGVAPPG